MACCERMFAGAFEASRQADEFILTQGWSDHHGHDFRLPFREGARFVEHERVDLLKGFERFGILEENSGLGAASGADHDCHGRGKAEGARTGDDEHCDRIHDRVGVTRFGTPDCPCGKSERGDRNHGWDKPCSDLVGKTLDRSSCTLRPADQLHDLREHGFAADPLGAHHERSCAIHGRTGDFAARSFFGLESARR